MDNEIPAENYAQTWTDDDRDAPPLLADERETLTAFLDWHRRTFELKCSGLTATQLSTRAARPSDLSLHGLIRHLAGVERWWFRIQFSGEEVPLLYYSDDDPNQDFDTLDGDPAVALDVWRAECAASRAIAARSSLDDTGRRKRDGQAFSMRWLLVNTVAEYARHNGHADLLREGLDGRTGH